MCLLRCEIDARVIGSFSQLKINLKLNIKK